MIVLRRHSFPVRLRWVSIVDYFYPISLDNTTQVLRKKRPRRAGRCVEPVEEGSPVKGLVEGIARGVILFCKHLR
jgi:hypothetical protein